MKSIALKPIITKPTIAKKHNTKLLFLACIFANANAMCFEPSEPFCLGYGSFDGKYKFNSCRDSVEDYLEDLDEYTLCVINESKEKAEEAIEKFNCKARGETFCY